MKKNTKKKLSSEELAAFCAQIASVLKAGISPGEGIAIMLEDTSSLQEQEILTAIQETLNATGVFSLGLEDAKVFPEYMRNMVRLGEQAGRLDEVMDSLAGHYQREADLSAALKSALTYPCIMIGMMVLVVLVLVTRVLPVFQQVYAQLGQTMTGPFQRAAGYGTGHQPLFPGPAGSSGPFGPCMPIFCQDFCRTETGLPAFFQAALYQKFYPPESLSAGLPAVWHWR